MEYLFISGAPSVGKTTTVHAVCHWLLSKYPGTDLRTDGLLFDRTAVPPALATNDFSFLFDTGDMKVLVHSATDDPYNADMLVSFISRHEPRIVISSCRDYPDKMRDYLCTRLNMQNGHVLASRHAYIQEFPLAKITRRTNWTDPYNWYFENTMLRIKAILSSAPYGL